MLVVALARGGDRVLRGDPYGGEVFDPRTFWLIMAGLLATFVVQEIFVHLAPGWKRRGAGDARVLAGCAPRPIRGRASSMTGPPGGPAEGPRPPPPTPPR